MSETADADAETVDAPADGGGRYLARGASAPKPGDTIGRLVVERVLGQGGEGVVVAARDPLLERAVAIKLLRPGRQLPEDRLLAEGKAIARLRHPNVVTVYDVGVHDDRVYIAMELIDGMSLREWLTAGPRRVRSLLEHIIAAGRGLAAAHTQGMVHGDFKPENVLVGRRGEVVVTDFGLARLAGDGPGSSAVGAGGEHGYTGPAAGTPAYLAPEQWAGAVGDQRADVFAFCVTLHEALYGHRPFEPAGGAPGSLAELAEAVRSGVRVRASTSARRRVPRQIERVLDRGLSVDPDARFPSMVELLPALARSSRRRWILPATIAAVAAASGAVAVAATTSIGSTDDRLATPRVGVCGDPTARISAAWSPAARARYLGSSGSSLSGAALDAGREVGTVGPDTAARAEIAREHARWLDQYAAAWAETHASVCDNDERDASAQAAAITCLDNALDALRVAAVGEAAIWPRLPELDACVAKRPVVHALPSSIPVTAQAELAFGADATTAVLSTKSADALQFALDGASRPRPLPGVWVALNRLDDGRLLTLTSDLRLELVAAVSLSTLFDGNWPLHERVS